MDSYRQLCLDIIRATEAHVELTGGPYEDASLAHVRAWQKRRAQLDRECTRILQSDEPFDDIERP